MAKTTKYEISEIEKLYPDWYDKEHPLTHDEQKWIWENLPLNEEDERKLRELGTNENVSVNRSVSGTYKQKDNSEQNFSKRQAITRLRNCNYLTPPKEIAFYLEVAFGRWEEKPTHWLYIAQYHTPKTINSVIAQMTKERQRGDKTFRTPGAYFTAVIKYRPKRKTLRRTSGTRKQRGL